MKLFNKLFYISLFLWTLMACDTDIVPDNGYIETTQSDASTFVMQGYEDSKKVSMCLILKDLLFRFI